MTAPAGTPAPRIIHAAAVEHSLTTSMRPPGGGGEKIDVPWSEYRFTM